MKVGTHISSAWVNIASFDKLADAEKLKNFLESRDVKSIVEVERSLQKYWFVSSPRAGVHVLVPEVALEMTRTQLATQPASWIDRI